ncbi:undecaprenyl-diphosphatase [Ramlibacter sp. G-1-2-2]|uniref:Undecaprenyl-diphosphatase n=1 Tax=Ramlibacter agri TaxID=2728837 RepID=A0A848H000_9BURK|nr:undecaprenyl-diphosphatase [Ramlibacter agri]NML42942.1 undecaprenyl-diphosphatase [Ramlibacter agri]
MLLNNVQLFESINASAATPHSAIAFALAIAQWLIWALPVGMVLLWLRGGQAQRLGLLEAALATFVALGIGQLVALAWPEPRPFMLHLGSQFLAHSADPGLPSDHTTVFWALAWSTLLGKRLARWSPALFALGLLVGWSRVFLGVHFPFDVAAALPVALAGALVVRTLRQPLLPAYGAALRCWAALARRVVRA